VTLCQNAKAQPKGQGAAGVASEQSLKLEGKQLSVAIGDETVSASTGKPLARLAHPEATGRPELAPLRCWSPRY